MISIALLIEEKIELIASNITFASLLGVSRFRSSAIELYQIYRKLSRKIVLWHDKKWM